MCILVVNAGSSTLKLSLFENAAETLATGLIDWNADPARTDLTVRKSNAEMERHRLDGRDRKSAVTQAVLSLVEKTLPSVGLPPLAVIGHRVVHGGTVFRDSVRIDRGVKSAVARLSELAPLHNPPALEAIEASETAFPGVAQVAVFDTAFFASLPARAYVYPLPYEWYSDWGIRRFGFHGISHAYCAGRALELLAREASGTRLVICHLGNGCSASAVRDGAAVATSMGFTPLEGMMMGTRSGSVDPGILIHVQKERGLSANDLDQILNQRSGLLGVSGVSSDYRQVERAAGAGNERARLALEMFADRVRATIGALAVTLGGLDALVFSAGIGENSANLRAQVCAGLKCLGARLDRERNAAAQGDADIAEDRSPARILVIQTREDVLIAREAQRLVGKG